MPEQTLKEKTAKGLFWGGLSTLVQQLIGMVFGIVIARILSPDDYGLVAMLAVFSVIASTFMDSGFTTALINKKEIRHEDYNSVFWFSIFCGMMFYVILFFTAPFIARFYNQPVLLNLSRVMFLGFVISGFGIVHNAVLFKEMKVKQRGIADMAAVLVSGGAGLIMALMGLAYRGLALQMVIQCFVSTSVRWYFSGWKPTLAFSLAPIKEMFGFSSKILFNGIIGQINGNIFSILLGKFYTKADTGYYSQGSKWMALGNTTVNNMINGVAQPVLVEVQDDKERQKKVFRKMLRFGAFVSFPSLLGLAFVAKEFVWITVGEKWLESVPYLQVLTIANSCMFISSLYTAILLSHGKSDTILYINTVFYIINLSLALALARQGIFTMVVGCSILTLLLNIVWHIFGKKQINIRSIELLKDISPYLLLTLFCFAVSWFVTRGIENMYGLFFAKIAVVAVLYVSILWLTRSVILKESMSFILRKR